MKICIACSQEKELSEFPPNKAKKDGLNPKCRECYNTYMKDWYRKPGNKKKQVIRSEVSRAKAIHKGRTLIWNYLLSHPCETCGETDPLVLEFDHLDRSDKEYSVSAMFDLSIEKIQKEIDKCRVLCANCHRRHTTIQLGTWRGTWTV